MTVLFAIKIFPFEPFIVSLLKSKTACKIYMWWEDWSCKITQRSSGGHIYVRFCKNNHRQLVCIPMHTNCASLVRGLFWYTAQLMTKLRKDPSQLQLIDKFNNTNHYLDEFCQLSNRTFLNTLPTFTKKNWLGINQI